MFKSSLIAVIGCVLAFTTGGPAAARDIGSGHGAAFGQDSQEQDAVQRQREREQNTGGRTGRRNRNSRAEAPPTPEQLVAAAQAIVTSANVSCQVTQATLLGQTAEGAASYEAACATGPGYIVIGSTPPQAIDCVLLAGQADIERARDPAADVGTQCAIPQNTDVVRVVAAYAAEAGIPCTVDQGASIGKSNAGNLIYEVGCAGVDGFWLEREAAGWKTSECATIITQNATCRYSTKAEQAATLKGRLASNAEAAACDVTEGRYMGANANGSFYEAKCGAGNGIIVRFDPAFAVQQVYPCETAQRIGGGCTLTVVSAPAATAPATE